MGIGCVEPSSLAFAEPIGRSSKSIYRVAKLWGLCCRSDCDRPHAREGRGRTGSCRKMEGSTSLRRSRSISSRICSAFSLSSSSFACSSTGEGGSRNRPNSLLGSNSSTRKNSTLRTRYVRNGGMNLARLPSRYSRVNLPGRNSRGPSVCPVINYR